MRVPYACAADDVDGDEGRPPRDHTTEQSGTCAAKKTSGGDRGLEQSQSQNATCWDYATFCIRWRTVAYANLPVMPGRAPSFTFAALIKDRRPPGG